MANSASKRSGGAATLTIDTVLVPIKAASPSFNKNMQVATDSADWDSVGQALHRSQYPGVLEVEVEVEFNFLIDVTQANILDKLMGNEPVAMVLALDDVEGTVILSGEFWVGEADLEIEVEEGALITGSATLTNEGIVTVGA